MKTPPLSRRTFLKISSLAGPGLLLGVHALQPPGGETLPVQQMPVPLTAFVEVAPTGQITIAVAKQEMGQGVHTSLAMLVAEELGVNWQQVQVRPAGFDPEKFGNQDTGGSQSVRDGWLPLRKAGAAAREMLIGAAAKKWGVRVEDCQANGGSVTHRVSGKSASYGELAEQAARLPVPQEPPLKDPRQFTLIGKGQGNVNTRAIVTGQATYGIDQKMHGMVYAVIERCPVAGGIIRRWNADRARAMPGVIQVLETKATAHPHHLRSGVAVLAENTWAALKGRDSLQIEWELGSAAGESTDALFRQMEQLAVESGTVSDRAGKPDFSPPPGRQVLEARYRMPFLAHAPLEPMNCVARVEQGKCTLWGSLQFPGWTAGSVAQALGIQPADVTIHPALIGGAFGRRINHDYAVEAALLAQTAGRPVKVLWTRSDDMQFGFFRPANYHRMQATLENKRISAWRHHVLSTSIMVTVEGPQCPKPGLQEVLGGAGQDLYYDIPNRLCEYTHVDSSIPRGWWRSVEMSFNVFAVESFVDELAHAAGQDPVQFRLNLLLAKKPFQVKFETYWKKTIDPRRLEKVLQLAAEKGGWNQPRPKERFLGIACFPYISCDSYVAHAVEVSVGPPGELRVHRVVCALDCGTVVNPDGVVAQMEGGVAFALSAALYGEITVANGQVQQRTYQDYPVLRMPQMPQVEVYTVSSTEPPGGTGEVGVPTVAPALANALFAATGRRLRQLPLLQNLNKG